MSLQLIPTTIDQLTRSCIRNKIMLTVCILYCSSFYILEYFEDNGDDDEI